MLPPAVRDRAVPAIASVMVLVAGLAVHASDAVPFADKLGDLLYAGLATLGVWVLVPSIRSWQLAVVAGGWCLLVELLQLTGVPDAAADLTPLSRLVLGSGFDPLDLVAYAVGVALVVVVRSAARRRRRARTPAEPAVRRPGHRGVVPRPGDHLDLQGGQEESTTTAAGPSRRRTGRRRT